MNHVASVGCYVISMILVDGECFLEIPIPMC